VKKRPRMHSLLSINLGESIKLVFITTGIGVITDSFPVD
jgi:hypothetical protein